MALCALVDHYINALDSGSTPDSMLVSLVTMLLRAGLDPHQSVNRLAVSYQILTGSDPMKHLLLVRIDAILQDGLDRRKVKVFHSGRWGRLLRRDIVELHVLPRAVTLGGGWEQFISKKKTSNVLQN